MLEGKLLVEKGKPVLQAQGKSIRLAGGDESISETLLDTRILGKQLRLQGEFRSDGSFEVSDLFAVNPDGLYKIVYYCNVCNITAFHPGNCICCQQPTILQEVPLTDPRVRHEEVKGPPK